jgi:hypothetical protein
MGQLAAPVMRLMLVTSSSRSDSCSTRLHDPAHMHIVSSFHHHRYFGSQPSTTIPDKAAGESGYATDDVIKHMGKRAGSAVHKQAERLGRHVSHL